MNFDLRFYCSLFLRRLPVMTALLLICSGVGVVTALKLPPIYSTAARMLVEEPQIEVDTVTLAVDAAQQLQVIEQQLMTRANLIDIAQQWRVFEDMRSMTPDTIVSEMRENTRILRSGGRGQATLMTIQFSGRSGQIVAGVVNEYVTLVLEKNKSASLAIVENALRFYEQEVGRLNSALDQQSAKIINFKNANSTALPDDLVYRQGRQTLLQERLSRLEGDRSGLINQRAEMVAVFEATGSLRPSGTPQRELSPEEQRLNALRLSLQEALGVYSETHPSVLRLKTQIEQLEAEIGAHSGIDNTDTEDQSGVPSLLDVTLTDIDQRTENIDRDIARTNDELGALEESISSTAANAITLDGLQREYENIQNQYNAAVTNLNLARAGERQEENDQGQRITIIENASVPQDPSGPGRTKIAAAGIGAGLGLAGGFFFLLEFLNRTIRRPTELRARFGIVPLASIPYMESRRERTMRRTILITAFVAVLISVPAILYYIDTQYMPLELLANKIINRLGIG
ncbi:MAG: chain length-determining protein [Paracoccaceae bacterium]